MSAGIGARLRSARERSRLTIMQAAESLHVDPDVLEALEAENFAALGAPVYVKGHLRHYAELIGESAESLSDLYSQGTRLPPPDLTRIPKALPDHAGRLVAPAVIVMIGFAVAGGVWWVLSLSQRPWSTAGARPVPATVAAATHSPPQSAVRLSRSAGEGAFAGRSGVSVALSSRAKASPPSAAIPAAEAALVPRGQIDVLLSYSADSWTEVYDATGRRLLYGLSTGPATRKLEGVAPLSVLLGDASGVSIRVGGRPVSIARFMHSDHTARFLIAADGRVLAAPPKKGG